MIFYVGGIPNRPVNMEVRFGVKHALSRAMASAKGAYFRITRRIINEIHINYSAKFLGIRCGGESTKRA